ncbi:MAG: hypothetical protein ISS80_04090 [Candidatus Cloacimonetes bacterium]|nr:hypothetical protein [Candidatus Cloacimonadota bacterium]MBL7149233.1 hypothetical protein [Candidatus Cloacimonadota bacterium]
MKKVTIIIMLVTLFALIGCATHIHTIGKGAQGGQMIETRQWYALWGLVPLNEVDTHAIAGDVTDYEIKTEQNALDIILNIFTSAISVYSRTVTVTK